jgi:hypothetical protein
MKDAEGMEQKNCGLPIANCGFEKAEGKGWILDLGF